MNEPIIKNAEVLGTTPLRRDALAILEAGYQAEVLRSYVCRTIWCAKPFRISSRHSGRGAPR